MGILEELSCEQTWTAYLRYKLEHQHLTRKEEQELREFVKQKKYKTVTDRMMEEGYCFEPPVRKCVNKKGTTKKRVVYSFSQEENYVLKCMAFLLYRYDYVMSAACYSFRRSRSAKDAVRKIVSMRGLSEMICIKADISNYFNSIPAPALCEILEEILGAEDPALCSFLKRLLMADQAYDQTRKGALLTEQRGAMAGIPVSPFFANIYLKDLDVFFEYKKIPYFRYSDDILIFVRTHEEAEQILSFLQSFLSGKGLCINPDKVSISAPGEAWEFLGIRYADGQIDLSENTRHKLYGKIRRKARAFYRWRLRKNVPYEQTAKAFIKIFNAKFYDEKDEKNFTWSRWFFPLLTVDAGLREIDAYFLEYIRYLNSGRHYKGNYRISYEQIKRLGYRSLVHEYWKYRSDAKKQ